MKTIEIDGKEYQMYDLTNAEELTKVKELKQFSGRSARFTVGRNYQLIGVVPVPANGDVKAYNGIVVKNIATGKTFISSVNSLIGVSITGSAGAWKVHTVKAKKWADADELLLAVKAGSGFSCTGDEDLDAQDFLTQTLGKKKFFTFA